MFISAQVHLIKPALLYQPTVNFWEAGGEEAGPLCKTDRHYAWISILQLSCTPWYLHKWLVSPRNKGSVTETWVINCMDP